MLERGFRSLGPGCRASTRKVLEELGPNSSSTWPLSARGEDDEHRCVKNAHDTINTTGGNAPVKAGPAEPLEKSIAKRLARVELLLAERQAGLPVWVRPPKSGPEHFSGLSRSKLYEGAGKKFFRSVSIREPGQLKGTRLFLLTGDHSILAFIERSEAAARATEGSAQ